jgi:AcrR family transcriptional regulator
MITEKKRKIYNAAAELFVEKGYGSASMRELADKVGLEPSSLYSHIRSKDEILSSICTRAADYFVDGIRTIYKSDKDAICKLDAIISLHLEAAYTSFSSVVVFNDEWKHLQGDVLVDFLTKRKLYEQYLLKIIKQGIDDNKIKKLNPRFILFTFLSSIKWIYHWYSPSKKINKKALEREVKEMVIRGLGK